MNRVNKIGETINLDLPSSYRAELSWERQRVEENVLAPRGLSERRILVIGGAGYIGSVITSHLLECGYYVRCLDEILYQNGITVVPHISKPTYEFVRGDHGDINVLEQVLQDVTDVVLLAGLVGDPITKKYPEASKRINDNGYDTIFRAIRKHPIERVIFVSTCSNYGMLESDQLADEGFELNPLSLYAKSKVRFEQLLLNPDADLGFAPTVLRFATAFGLSPRMRFDLTVSEFTRALFLHEDLLVYDAHTWRPYCHVQDFAEVIRRVLEAPESHVCGEVFNAGGDKNNFTKQMIVDEILTALPGRKVKYQEHGSDPRNYRVDFTRIKKTLHFEPTYSVTDGVRELIGAMQQGLFHDIKYPESFHGNWVLLDAVT